jgi:hypothetical protein
MPTTEYTERQIAFNKKQLLYQQKFNHQIITKGGLSTLNFILMILYYGCILAVFYYLYTKYDISIYSKVGFVILLLIYPFVILFIETYIYQAVGYGWAFIIGEPYTPAE